MSISNGRSLKDYPFLPQLDISDLFPFKNVAKEHAMLFKSLTDEQMRVYDDIMNAILSKHGGFLILYGYGGKGKTFMWKTLSTAIRSKGMIVLNVASNGIVPLLLPGGKTAHSTFCIPLLINEESTCNITQGSLRGKLLMATCLII